MNAVLEFHDSEVAGVHADGTTLHVAFSAAHIHRSAGTDAGGGYLQGVSLTLAQATWTGDLRACAGKVSQGEVRVAGAAVGLLPIPGVFDAPVTLRIQFSDGVELRAAAATLRVDAAGDARFVEDFSC